MKVPAPPGSTGRPRSAIFSVEEVLPPPAGAAAPPLHTEPCGQGHSRCVGSADTEESVEASEHPQIEVKVPEPVQEPGGAGSHDQEVWRRG